MNKSTLDFKYDMRTIILYGVILLNLLPIILAICFAFWYMKFPTFSHPSYSMLIIVGYLLPSLICCLLLMSKSAHKKRWLSLATTLVVVLAIVISAGCVLLSILLFPIKSSTTNYRNYMVLDKVTLPYTEPIRKFFPEEIPISAKNIKYSYDLTTGLLGEYIEIKASWELPQEEYLDIVKSVESTPLFENGQDSTWKLILPDAPYSYALEQFIEFDQSRRRVIYSAVIDN
nr:hypothetical protein [uncultured Niameybacter sp.]